MDFNLNKLKEYVDVYNITSVANRVKNALYNYTYYEIRVREATSDEKWGASSTLLQEIAQGTYRSANFDEIMNTIYYRLENKKDYKWRQIHKTLQLVEYLVKCGSERVIDCLREKLNLITPLTTFDYIDPSGRDYGSIVRKRAKILVTLLRSTDQIRAERKKFFETSKKFFSVSSEVLNRAGGGLENFKTIESAGYTSKYKDDFPNSAITESSYSDAPLGPFAQKPSFDTFTKPTSLFDQREKAQPKIVVEPLIDFGEEPPKTPPVSEKRVNNIENDDEWGEFIEPSGSKSFSEKPQESDTHSSAKKSLAHSRLNESMSTDNIFSHNPKQSYDDFLGRQSEPRDEKLYLENPTSINSRSHSYKSLTNEGIFSLNPLDSKEVDLSHSVDITQNPWE